MFLYVFSSPHLQPKSSVCSTVYLTDSFMCFLSILPSEHWHRSCLLSRPPRSLYTESNSPLNQFAWHSSYWGPRHTGGSGYSPKSHYWELPYRYVFKLGLIPECFMTERMHSNSFVFLFLEHIWRPNKIKDHKTLSLKVESSLHMVKQVKCLSEGSLVVLLCLI